MNGNGFHWIKGLLIGGIAGGIAGLLLAPKSGREMRKDIGDRAAEYSNRMKDEYGQALEKGKERYEGLMKHLQRAETAGHK